MLRRSRARRSTRSGAGEALLELLDAIAIVESASWPVPDPGRLLAAAIGAGAAGDGSGVETSRSTTSGCSPIELLADSCGRIVAGELEVGLIGGIECFDVLLRAMKAGREPGFPVAARGQRARPRGRRRDDAEPRGRDRRRPDRSRRLLPAVRVGCCAPPPAARPNAHRELPRPALGAVRRGRRRQPIRVDAGRPRRRADRDGDARQPPGLDPVYEADELEHPDEPGGGARRLLPGGGRPRRDPGSPLRSPSARPRPGPTTSSSPRAPTSTARRRSPPAPSARSGRRSSGSTRSPTSTSTRASPPPSRSPLASSASTRSTPAAARPPPAASASPAVPAATTSPTRSPRSASGSPNAAATASRPRSAGI